MSSLQSALITSGHASNIEEADVIISRMRDAVVFGREDPEEVLEDYCLEPDYVFELLKIS